jgi:hypothetical protein
MVVYDSAAIYIDSCTTLQAKITAIDQIIDALLSVAAKSAAGDNISEYSLNDGQTQIRTVYKGADQVTESIQKFEKLKQLYVNRLNGRAIRLVDAKNFT